MLAKVIQLFSIATLIVAQESSAINENEDILFKIPDIVTTYKMENGDEVKLAAYKTQETNDLISQAQRQNRALIENEISRLHWMTAGVCSFVTNQIFPRDDHIEIGMNCLNEHIRAHLAKKASEKHRIPISSDRILLLTFSQVVCRAESQDPLTKAKLRFIGKVTTFQTNPLKLEVYVTENTQERTTFEQLQNATKMIIFTCELSANGKTETKNQLTINFQEASMTEMMDRVLGEANSSFVTRYQMAKLSQELYSSLDIEEMYEMPESMFSESFVEDFIRKASFQSSFYNESIDRVLNTLSKYTLDFSEDLRPDTIQRDLGSLYSLNETAGETKVIVDRDAYYRFRNKYGSAFSQSAMQVSSNSGSSSSDDRLDFGFGKLSFGLLSSGQSSSSLSQSSNSASSGMLNTETDNEVKNRRLNDELRRHKLTIASAVNFEIVGNRIVPKSILVAKILRANVRREMRFNRIRKSLHKAPFRQTVRVVLNVSISIDISILNRSISILSEEIIKAVEAGNEATVRTLLNEGADVNARKIREYRSKILLHIASENGHVNVVSLLLDKGANIEAKDTTNSTPLHCAAWHGRVNVVSLLLDKGANIEAKDTTNSTPLHCAAWHGRVNVVSLLLDKGANIEAKDTTNSTPLHCAAWHGRVNVVSLLLDKGANIEARNTYNYTPLLFAVEQGRVNVVSLLLDKGANIEARTTPNYTPLHYAAQYGDVNVVSLLLDKGANIEARNTYNYTPLLFAVEQGRVNVVSLLLDKGANIEARTTPNYTPLHYAAQYGDVNVVSLLLDKGANIEARATDNSTPLNHAAHVNVVSLLLDKGANIEARTTLNLTSLHGAAWKGNVNVVSLLLDKGANIFAKGSWNWTPLDSAKQENKTEIVKILERKQRQLITG